MWSAERCKRLGFTGLSGTPKITMGTADSRAEQGKSTVKGGGEVTRCGPLRRPMRYPLNYEGLAGTFTQDAGRVLIRWV